MPAMRRRFSSRMACNLRSSWAARLASCSLRSLSLRSFSFCSFRASSFLSRCSWAFSFSRWRCCSSAFSFSFCSICFLSLSCSCSSFFSCSAFFCLAMAMSASRLGAGGVGLTFGAGGGGGGSGVGSGAGGGGRGAAALGRADHSSASTAGVLSVGQLMPQVRAMSNSKCTTSARPSERPKPWAGGGASSRCIEAVLMGWPCRSRLELHR